MLNRQETQWTRKKFNFVLITVISSIMLLLASCGGGANNENSDANEEGSHEASVRGNDGTANHRTGSIRTISDLSEAWGELDDSNMDVINESPTLVIFSLVSPALVFVEGIQLENLNPDQKDGHYEGRLLLSGYDGYNDQKGNMITFGYNKVLEEDGMGLDASLKAGDRKAAEGFLDMNESYFKFERIIERDGGRFSTIINEFKQLEDGSIICLELSGSSVDLQGNESKYNQFTYIHNKNGGYDFVIANAEAGPEFQAVSFEDEGEMTVDQAEKAFVAAGYSIESKGGIVDGEFVVHMN